MSVTRNSAHFWLLLLTFPLLCLMVTAAPATDVNVMVDDPQRIGCMYDGKFYNESQPVATKEPCLNCSCQNGALRCHLQVCPFLHDAYPPPAGCVLVERKNACCPKLHCPTITPVGNRLLRKDPTGQMGAWKVREDLRKRLVKHLAKSGTDKQGCVEDGTLYAEGSAMMTSSTCEYCFCLKGKQTCVKPRCAEPTLEGCIPRFRDLACCPTHYDCAISTPNATSVVTKKITPVEHRGDRVRPIIATTLGSIRGNDRVIDSSTTATSTLHHHKPKNSRVFRKKMLTKRNVDNKKSQDAIKEMQTEEPIAVTLGPDSLLEENPLAALENIAAAAIVHTTIGKLAKNDIRLDAIDPLEPEAQDHQDSLAVEGSLVESRVPAPSMIPSSVGLTTDLPDDLSSIKAEDSPSATVAMVATAALAAEPLEEDIIRPTTEEPVDPLSPSHRLDEEGPEIANDDDELETDAAERTIEVSVSSSISSVSQSSNAARPGAKEEAPKKVNTPVSSFVPAAPQSSGNFLPIDNKVAKPLPDGQTLPSTPLAAVEEEPLDYDYSNMELPPSLPNLEIIPFVAADAVMGVPNFEEEDERLNLGGVVEQRTSASHAALSDQSSKSEHCFSGSSFFNHGELIKSQPGEPDDPCKLCRCMLGQVVCHETQCAPLLPGCRRLDLPDFCCGRVVCGGNVEDRVDAIAVEPASSAESSKTGQQSENSKQEMEGESTPTTSTSTTSAPSPAVAFRVTFPPRPSTTLPPPPAPPTFFTRRFTPNRPTPRTSVATTPRSFSNKFNKPAVNNLVGVPAPFSTGGLRIDSCNIYGQMYRVGRIIDELSSPCVECKCTEIGVNCVNLKC